MDRITDSPWSWEEEIQWKTVLEEGDDGFLQDLIDNAVDVSATDSLCFIGTTQEEPSEDATTDEYLVTT